MLATFFLFTIVVEEVAILFIIIEAFLSLKHGENEDECP
jgi:hypothetical protein